MVIRVIEKLEYSMKILYDCHLRMREGFTMDSLFQTYSGYLSTLPKNPFNIYYLSKHASLFVNTQKHPKRKFLNNGKETSILHQPSSYKQHATKEQRHPRKQGQRKISVFLSQCATNGNVCHSTRNRLAMVMHISERHHTRVTRKPTRSR